MSVPIIFEFSRFLVLFDGSKKTFRNFECFAAGVVYLCVVSTRSSGTMLVCSSYGLLGVRSHGPPSERAALVCPEGAMRRATDPRIRVERCS
jgi:hypothetical protein